MKKILFSIFTITLLSMSTALSGEISQSTTNGNPLGSILMIIVFFVIFWFLLIRPQQKKNKELRRMLSELSKGDEIVTNGGIIGKIVKINETFIDLEISDNILIKIQRNAVANILPKGSVK